MKALNLFVACAAIAFLSGCGGGGIVGDGPGEGDVSGIVVDINGDVVRNALVYVDGGPSTRSNSSGSYILKNVFGNERTIRAEITQDGIDYYGEQLARIFNDDQSHSVNITMVRESQRAEIRGTVVDRNGNLIEGAIVYAISNNVSHSTMDETDEDGVFIIDTLQGGVEYTIVASARNYNSDTEFVTIAAGDTEEILLTLGNPDFPTLNPPQGMEAVAWTSPNPDNDNGPTRSPSNRAYIENVKRLVKPGYKPKTSTTRTTALGNYVEVDVFWDFFTDESLLGFGIYRRFGNSGPFEQFDFYRDPLANLYIDLSPELQEFQTWSYYVTSLNVGYPDEPEDESAPSEIVTVQTLGDLELLPIGTAPLQFRWEAGSGAETYAVYLFDRYPGLGVNAIWNTEASQTNGFSQNYTGPSLQSGRTYYYLVVGQANGETSITISPVGQFVAS